MYSPAILPSESGSLRDNHRLLSLPQDVDRSDSNSRGFLCVAVAADDISRPRIHHRIDDTKLREEDIASPHGSGELLRSGFDLLLAKGEFIRPCICSSQTQDTIVDDQDILIEKDDILSQSHPLAIEIAVGWCGHLVRHCCGWVV
jgi:hypothetical protein